MLLAVDVGNTNAVFALADLPKTVEEQGRILHVWRCETNAQRSSDEYAAFLNQVFNLAGVKWEQINDVIIASVVPGANFHLEQLCIKYAGIKPVFVDHTLSDLAINLKAPDELGADRLVNAVAAHDKYKLPLIIIDFGTATTFDVLDAQGTYQGGVIAPGINLSLQALERAAAKLPLVGIKKPAHVIGKSTKEAIQSGVYWGYIGLIEKICAKIEQELGENCTVIATGGLAPLYAENSKIIETIDQDLTLNGLIEIYQRNKNKE